MPSSAPVRLSTRPNTRRNTRSHASTPDDVAPSQGRSGPGTLRVLFVALLVTSGAVFFINGAQMVVRQSRVSMERELHLEACQKKLLETSTSCEAKAELAGRERHLLSQQAQRINASCAVARISLERSRREKEKCEGEREHLSVTMKEIQNQSRKDEDKAADCARALRKSQQDVRKCEGEVERLSGVKLHVTSGNEDLLQMEPQDLILEIQNLRTKVKDLEDQAQNATKQKGSEVEERVQALADKNRQLEKDTEQLEQDKARLEEERDKLMNKTRGLEEDKAECEQSVGEQGEIVRHLQDKLDATHTPPADAETSGYKCRASEEEMREYNKYRAEGDCPDDWPLSQKLIFRKGCTALPRRKCRSLTPPEPLEPLPRPLSLFSPSSLVDSNVRWNRHTCQSFSCLNTRKTGECLKCFNLQSEEDRWQKSFRGSIPMADVISLKNGTLRIGLDVGGGSGSFAAHMARHGVQVMTMSMDGETVKGKIQGIPLLETIALRGLIPLFLPPQARLPFFDGTLDLVHSINGIQYLEPSEFADMLYEWDRVLRVGGLLWFETFHRKAAEMPDFVTVIEGFGYKKLYWNFTAVKGSSGTETYFNCVMEKTPHPGGDISEQSASETKSSAAE